jgi:hypothetical protein
VANTYVVQTVVENLLTDTLTVTGTVNGTPVVVSTWISAAGNSLASAIGFENFIAPLMLAAYNALTGPTAVPALQGLTFTK